MVLLNCQFGWQANATSTLGEGRPIYDGRAMSASPPKDGVIGRRACG